MKAIPVNAILRDGALALALLGGAALTSAPASANSVDNEGYFGGSWSSIGPTNYYERRHAGRVGPLYGNRVYVAPYYAYGPAYYGPSAYYGVPDDDYAPGPNLTYVGPGAVLSIGVD
jgi:hypothetical protein